METNHNRNPFNLQKAIIKLLVFSLLLLSGYAYTLGCGKKERDIKKDVVDHKIISLGDDIGLTENGDNPFYGNQNAMERGKAHYSTLCVVCHGVEARGNTGPDLVDNVWLHGGDNFSIYNIIMNGVKVENMKMNPPRGKMPGYKNILGSRKILELMAWLESEVEKNK